MKFEKLTAENGYLTLMVELCLNSMFFLEIQVEDIIFSVINIKSFVRMIFSVILYKKGCDLELKYTYNSYNYSSIK